MKLNEWIKKNGNREILDMEELEKHLQKMKPEAVDDLKPGDPYWGIDSCGFVSRGVWEDTETEHHLREQGRIFLTKQSAVEKQKYDKICEELKRMTDGYKYKLGRDNWCLVAVCDLDNGWEVKTACHNCVIDSSAIYFPLEESLLRAVEQIGEDRLLREYFRLD